MTGLVTSFPHNSQLRKFLKPLNGLTNVAPRPPRWPLRPSRLSPRNARWAAQPAPHSRRARLPQGLAASDATRSLMSPATCSKTTQPALITRALVAREVGVDPSLIRYYFGNRAALLAAAAARLTELYGEMIEKPGPGSGRQPGKPSARTRPRALASTSWRRTPISTALLTEEIMPSNPRPGSPGVRCSGR